MVEPNAVKGSEQPATGHVSRPRRVTAPLARKALAEVIAAGPTGTPLLVNELLDADKRLSSWIAFVPFMGPWLIQRSDVHTNKEKLVLTWSSIVLTALGLSVLVSQLPTSSDRSAKLNTRITEELKTLGDFADRHRAERGSYPDETTWSHLADRADPRFFDPWGRRYHYAPSTSAVTISTFGRDGSQGGTGEDADRAVRFEATSQASRRS